MLEGDGMLGVGNVGMVVVSVSGGHNNGGWRCLSRYVGQVGDSREIVGDVHTNPIIYAPRKKVSLDVDGDFAVKDVRDGGLEHAKKD